MQTLREVFRREDERLNLFNMSICIAVVVLLVMLAFGMREMRFVFQQSPAETPAATATQTTSEEGN